MYNRNCNLSPMMLTPSFALAHSEQYKLILTLKQLFIRSTFTTGRAHYGQLKTLFNNVTRVCYVSRLAWPLGSLHYKIEKKT